jgi:putative sigma-54 modulation protein
MDLVVVGKHTEVDTALRALTKEKIDRLSKFAPDVRRVDVDYGEHRTRRVDDSHTCEILVHVNHHLVKGTAAAAEHAVALDLALDKVERQLRRLHERRVRRRNGARARSVRNENLPVGTPGEHAEHEGGDGERPDRESPTIVKTKRFAVKPMDPEEAALQMELLGHDFFVFRSTENGRAAVLYRRRDGALGLIEVSG